MIVISDHKIVKEMFSQSAFSGRIYFPFFDFFLDGSRHGKQNRNKLRIVIIRLKKLTLSRNVAVIWSCMCEKFRLWVLGVINSEGPHWEQLRQFTLRQLRDFGFGKNTMQESIMTEVNEFIELMVDAKGEPVRNVKGRLILAVVNALWFIATGIRHKQEDPEIIALTKKTDAYAINTKFAMNVKVYS